MPLRVSGLEPQIALACPCCSGSPAPFLPIPDAYIDECVQKGVEHPLDAWETLNLQAYLCPECGATDRDRLQVLYLETVLKPGMRVLEIAPSQHVSSRLLRNDIDYRSCDLERADVDDQVDITNMACYADGAFDIVICSHVLEHVPDDLKAMREIRRLLSEKGIALLLVPISLAVDGIVEDIHCTNVEERWRRFGQGDHIRIYGRREFERRLREAGFQVSSFIPADPASHGLSNTARLYLGRI